MILQVKTCSHGVVWKLHWYAVRDIFLRGIVGYEDVRLYASIAIKPTTTSSSTSVNADLRTSMNFAFIFTPYNPTLTESLAAT